MAKTIATERDINTFPMSKESSKSPRRRSSATTPKRIAPRAKSTATLTAEAVQAIAVSQARRQQLRANVAALTHLLFKNFQLTAMAQQLRIARKSQPAMRRTSPNPQLFGEVGTSIVNEISQPLGAILFNLGAANHLLGVKYPELHEILADVRADTLRACGIVQDMRELFEGNIIRKTPLQVNAIVENLVRTLNSEANQRHAPLMADLSVNLPEVFADRGQIEQAITNLIWNAMEAMEETHPRERSVVIATRYLPEDSVEITVSDTGDGIPANFLPHIFETYFTTKRDRIGLGLAVARSIADLHQGAITAENNRDRGATFRLRLPIRHVDDPAKSIVSAVTAAR